MIKPTRVLLVEDEPLWQEAIRILLLPHAEYQVVGVADSFESAICKFQETHPQIVLLDWKIKGDQDGLAVGKAFIKNGMRPEHIILITGSSPSSIPTHPFLYLPKNKLSEALISLLHSVNS